MKEQTGLTVGMKPIRPNLPGGEPHDEIRIPFVLSVVLNADGCPLVKGAPHPDLGFRSENGTSDRVE